MSKQYFNCHQGPKHYFNNPDFNEPCCCAENSLKKVLESILDIPNLDIQNMYISGSTNGVPVLTLTNIEFYGDLLVVMNDNPDTPYPLATIPLCNVKTIEFLIPKSATGIFNDLLKQAFPIVSNCGNKTCCCTDDLASIYQYYKDLYPQIDFSSYTFTFNLNAAYPGTVDPFALQPYDFIGSVVTADCQVAIIETTDTDTINTVEYVYYQIVPLCSIDSVI